MLSVIGPCGFISLAPKYVRIDMQSSVGAYMHKGDCGRCDEVFKHAERWLMLFRWP